MLSIKVVTQPNYISFHFISKKWVQYLNLVKDVYATLNYTTDTVFPKTDVTILHEAVAVLDHYKPDRSRDGVILCADVSDTDMVSEKMAKRLNENCDAVITPTEFSAWGLKRGGVHLPIHVVHHGCDLPVVDHEKRVGFYVSTTNEQFVRKGSYISLEVASRIKYPKVIKLFPDYMKVNIDNAELLGKLDDMTEFYRKAGIFVLPVLGGAFELTALEALCTGAVAITTDHPIFAGLPTITVKSKYVPRITMPPHLMEYHIGGGFEPDINDVIKKIEYVWDNYDKEVGRVKKALKALRELYSWHKVAEKIIEVASAYT